MSEAQAEGSDRYQGARENLRDTIKWLAAAFASMGAVVVAGSPFSGIGAFTSLDARFVLALASLVVSFAAVAFGIYALLRLLVPDVLRISDLAEPRPDAKNEPEELSQLREYIRANSRYLLPLEHQTVQSLIDAVLEQQNLLRRAKTEKVNNLDAYQGAFDALSREVQRLLDFAVYMRLYLRVQNARPALAGCAAVTLVALLAFAWASNPPKPEKDDSAQPVVVHCAPPPIGDGPEPVRLEPVRFATGSAAVPDGSLGPIAGARDFLRENPDTALLLLAHTDTVGAPPINDSLAHRRGAAVRQRLLQLGGISPARVFVAELPETDLPVLTNQEQADVRNRSVEFQVVALPPAAGIR